MSSSTGKALRLVFAPAIAALIAALAVACGGDSGAPSGAGTPAGGDETPGGSEPATFDVSLGDTPEGTNFFQPNEFTVSAGQQVTFNLTNDGAAVHNMRVDGGDGAFLTGDDTISDPESISAGETGTLVWTAPDTPGTVIFQCDFHPTDMTGTISVE